MTRVIVVGSANVDVISRVERLPRPGETVAAHDAAVRPGGKGANQAVAASRLGADTTFFAAIGVDVFGQQIRSVLRDERVRIDHVIDVPDETTGVATIVVAADGENTIAVSPGANAALDAAAIAELSAALAPGDVVLLQLEIPLPTCVAAAAAAQRAGARVVLNAAPPPRSSADVDRLLSTVDVLVVNETEATAMSGWPADATEPNWIDVADVLRRRGPRACVITLGGRGAVACDDAGGWAQPPFRAEVVDTTGAGDAFCGALAASLAAGGSLADAVRDGCAAGSLATESLGAQSALPTRKALDRLIGGAE
jgi:ribokinase